MSLDFRGFSHLRNQPRLKHTKSHNTLCVCGGKKHEDDLFSVSWANWGPPVNNINSNMLNSYLYVESSMDACNYFLSFDLSCEKFILIKSRSLYIVNEWIMISYQSAISYFLTFNAALITLMFNFFAPLRSVSCTYNLPFRRAIIILLFV